MTSAAQAGGYVSLGRGAGGDLRGDLATNFSSAESTTNRLSLGQRTGPFAIEATVLHTPLRGVTAMTGSGEYTSTSVGIDVKYLHPLSAGVEGYLRAGINQNYLRSQSSAMDFGASGRGMGLGAGLQYAFRLPMAAAAVWIDYNHQEMDLRGASTPALSGGINTFTLGLSMGTNL